MTFFQSSSLYQNFFPLWTPYYTRMLAVNCSTQLEAYLSSKPASLSQKGYCLNVATCLIENTEEKLKFQMTVTGILLGLLPTVLSLLGSNATETSLLSTRRPVLSFLLCLGSPALTPNRLYDYDDPIKMLNSSVDQLMPSRPRKVDGAFLSAVQYALALGAIANVTMVALELCQKSYSVTLGCNTRWLILFWTFLPAALHILGRLAFSFRGQVDSKYNSTTDVLETAESPNHKICIAKCASCMKRWFQWEVTPCSGHSKLMILWGRETVVYIGLMQILTIATVVHIFLGTAIFSSYLFLAPSDAVPLIARHLASAWICRAVTRFELSGMRRNIGNVENMSWVTSGKEIHAR
jgi:hypothetical protein